MNTTRTTEAQLLMTFQDRMLPYQGQAVSADIQAAVLQHGADIVKALQQNHGHSLADAVGLMRAVLNGLNIK